MSKINELLSNRSLFISGLNSIRFHLRTNRKSNRKNFREIFKSLEVQQAKLTLTFFIQLLFFFSFQLADLFV